MLQIHPSKTHSRDQEIKNCLDSLKTAFLRWLIVFSLYEAEGTLFLIDIPVFEYNQKNKCSVQIESNEFKCADWQKFFKQRLLEENFPDSRELTIEDLLTKLFTDCYSQAFIKSLKNRYFFSDEMVAACLWLKPLRVSDKTIRNNFKDLYQRPDKLLKKPKRGYYSKIKPEEYLRILYSSQSSISENNDYSDVLDYLTNDLSTITELLMTKINGKQRLFVHHEYVAIKELREESANFADRLKEIWKKATTPPLQINYYSASLNQKGQYIVYPVSLYYYQRAYYLCAYGQAPKTESSEQLQWYNYRLDRISAIKVLSWDNVSLPLDKSKVVDSEVYSPEYI
ncbi:TIGR03985 family CRISPR-associated protein, partial [Merismopedia glauca]|uniref:TIGR03985 family CRISPR-associated protein n=1 Tax=Merismopedia glauca TaxID=292586 RepID=UPI0015E6E355